MAEVARRDFFIQPSERITTVEEFRQFVNLFIKNMRVSFRDKVDVETVTSKMESRFVGLIGDLQYSQVLENGYTIVPSIGNYSINPVMELSLVDPAGQNTQKFFEFQFENTTRASLEPVTDVSWLHNQEFIHAGGFLRGVAYALELRKNYG